MEKFENWHEFWDNFLEKQHGKAHVASEDDLYLQVARTVNKKPVPKEVFDAIIFQVRSDLMLSKEDVLVDFCCGNGLFTYELRKDVKQIIGVDFSQNIIDTANQYRPAKNITYCLGDVVNYMKTFATEWPGIAPTKYLMNDSLAYFSVDDLYILLSNILSVSAQFRFLIRGVPNEDLKWNYYNTPERKQFYYDLQAKGDTTNAGLGSWWQPGDIREVCRRLDLSCIIRNEELPVSDYRMDVLITKGDV